MHAALVILAPRNSVERMLRRALDPLASLALTVTVALATPLLVPQAAYAQAVTGVCSSCGAGSVDPNCGACVADSTGMPGGQRCFDALDVAERRTGVFTTSDGMDARRLNFAHLVAGAPRSATDINRSVSRAYNGNNVWLYYGTGSPPGYCAPAGGPPAAFPSGTGYVFDWDHRYEDTMNGLDCYNGEVDRFYVGAAGHADGDRVCDGEQAMFNAADGAIFDLGGEANRVAVFPFTDHVPLPCESFEYTVWLSDNPNATEVADRNNPDPNKWNPSLLIRAFLQGWIPDSPVSADPFQPDLNNPTQRDGIVQVFALPCGLTFRYASVVAGNNGNPSPACQFWSFDAELDAVAGLNEDDTGICPDADGDGYRAMSCGGNDCNDADPHIHPNARETCSNTSDVDCDGTVAMCPTGTTCFGSRCVPSCLEGACAADFTCVSADAGQSYCVPSACVGVTCPAGQICGPTGCQDPCAGARCPTGQVCRDGACFDPCLGVMCPAHQHCIADNAGIGRCAADCSCVPCAAPSVCSSTSGRCEAPGCSDLTCPAGSTRDCSGATPRCVAPCEGVFCPVGTVCDPASGNCARDMCSGVACQSGLHCAAGMCIPDERPDAGNTDAGGTSDGGMDGGMRDGSANRDGSADGGPGANRGACGCSTPGSNGRGHTLVIGALSLALALASRRRRRA